MKKYGNLEFCRLVGVLCANMIQEYSPRLWSVNRHVGEAIVMYCAALRVICRLFEYPNLLISGCLMPKV